MVFFSNVNTVNAATNNDLYIPTATDDVYTIFDVNVSVEHGVDNILNFTVVNNGFATIKDWSISFEADYNIVSSDEVEILDNSDVKTIAPKDVVFLSAGDTFEFEITTENDTNIDTDVEYRVYGIFDETSLNQCDEEYIDSLLISSDFVEYDCKTGETKLMTVDPDDIELLDEAVSQSKSVANISNKIKPNGIDMQSIIGFDNRTRVTAVTTGPYYKIGFLYITAADDKTYVGTGFLISENYMLTAAHCLYMSGKPIKSITAYFGANGNNYEVSANSIAIGWCTSYISMRNIANDWGYIKLDWNVGNTCGWFGIGYATDAYLGQSSYTIFGYPSDKATYNRNSQMHGQNVQMWKDSGRLTNIYYDYFTYKMDTYGGQSGSPVFNSSSQIVYGIHHGENVSGVTNGASRITQGIFTHLLYIGACSY